MKCPKTLKCGYPCIKCMISIHCFYITKFVCSKPSRKHVNSLRHKSVCKYGVKKSKPIINRYVYQKIAPSAKSHLARHGCCVKINLKQYINI